MIRSFIFSDGKLVGQDLELEALRLVRSDKGLLMWVDLDNPTPDEIKSILEGVFQFHPLAIEDCVQPNSLPKVEDYDEYLFIVTHAVDFTRTEKFNTTELDLFLGKDYVVTFHTAPLRSVTTLIERFAKAAGPGPRTLALPGFTSVSPMICYEIAFPQAVTDNSNRPGWIVNVSNDAWFGAWGPPQHLAQARLRAIEERLPVARATPTGISAVVDGFGRVRVSMDQGAVGSIPTSLPPPQPESAAADINRNDRARYLMIVFSCSSGLR